MAKLATDIQESFHCLALQLPGHPFPANMLANTCMHAVSMSSGVSCGRAFSHHRNMPTAGMYLISKARMQQGEDAATLTSPECQWVPYSPQLAYSAAFLKDMHSRPLMALQISVFSLHGEHLVPHL